MSLLIATASQNSRGESNFKFFPSSRCLRNFSHYSNHSISPPSFEKEIAKDARKKLKEERQRKKERKRSKKAKMEKECLTEKMNCFSHDSNHWRTEPIWDDKPFCFCMNANNNTFSCLRTINQTHNYLYCEFTTGLITFYNLKKGEICRNDGDFGRINSDFAFRSVRDAEYGTIVDCTGEILPPRYTRAYEGLQRSKLYSSA
jgi:hypothetical protein